MRTLVILAVLGVCAAFPRASIPDTPEVQAAKAQFNALFAQQAAAAAAAPDIHIYSRQAKAIPSSSGTIGETPEVQQATAEFFRAYAAALAATSPNSGRAVAPAPGKWTGPLAATVPAGVPGSSPNVADTADVQAAKAAFEQAFQQQLRSVAVLV